MAIKAAESIASDMQLAFNDSPAVLELENQLRGGLIAPLDFARKIVYLWDQFQQEILSYT